MLSAALASGQSTAILSRAFRSVCYPAAVAPRFCPTIQELRVVQKQRIKARRSKLYYLRDRKASEFKV